MQEQAARRESVGWRRSYYMPAAADRWAGRCRWLGWLRGGPAQPLHEIHACWCLHLPKERKGSKLTSFTSNRHTVLTTQPPCCLPTLCSCSPALTCRGVVLLRRWLDELAGGGPQYGPGWATNGISAGNQVRCGEPALFAQAAQYCFACRRARRFSETGQLSCSPPQAHTLPPCPRLVQPLIHPAGAQQVLSRWEILDRYEQHTRHCPSCRRVSESLKGVACICSAGQQGQ